MGSQPYQASPSSTSSVPLDQPSVKKPAVNHLALDPGLADGAGNAPSTAAAGELGQGGAAVARQLDQEQRRKLLVVLASIDPANILQQQVTLPDLATVSLHQAVASPAALVPFLRTSINNAATSALFDSPDTTRHALDAIDEFRRTALALLDELDTQKGARGVKRENEENGVDEAVAPPPSKKYMLHRGLDSMDLFTSAASLNDADLAQLASAEDTDIIAVIPGPEPSAPLPEIPAPTLGALNPRPPPVPAPPAGPPEPKPVSLLYYDPYQSFAPSYDSTGSTLSYAQSTRRNFARTRLRQWETDLALVDTSPLPPPPPSPPARTRLELSEEEKRLLREVGIESEQLELGWEEVEGQLEVWQKLRGNGQLLGELMRGQWGRLRSGRGGEEPGKGEAEAASRLYDSFSALLASRPHLASNSTSSLVPSATTLHAALPTFLASMAREAAYQGTMDPANQRAVRESAMEGKGKDVVMGGY